MIFVVICCVTSEDESYKDACTGNVCLGMSCANATVWLGSRGIARGVVPQPTG